MIVPVNSSHHQSADAIGEALRPVARCPADGIIEALEGTSPDHFVLAVQWHPERSDQDEHSRAIFRALVKASRVGFCSRAIYRPAPSISLLSSCATAGYAAALRLRKSRGNSDRSSHNAPAAAAAHVMETSASCIISATRLPRPVLPNGTALATSKLITPAMTAANIAFPSSFHRISPSRTRPRWCSSPASASRLIPMPISDAHASPTTPNAWNREGINRQRDHCDQADRDHRCQRVARGVERACIKPLRGP